MRLNIFGTMVAIGEQAKHGKYALLAVADSEGKGYGIYTED